MTLFSSRGNGFVQCACGGFAVIQKETRLRKTIGLKLFPEVEHVRPMEMRRLLHEGLGGRPVDGFKSRRMIANSATRRLAPDRVLYPALGRALVLNHIL